MIISLKYYDQGITSITRSGLIGCFQSDSWIGTGKKAVMKRYLYNLRSICMAIMNANFLIYMSRISTPHSLIFLWAWQTFKMRFLPWLIAVSALTNAKPYGQSDVSHRMMKRLIGSTAASEENCIKGTSPACCEKAPDPSQTTTENCAAGTSIGWFPSLTASHRYVTTGW